MESAITKSIDKGIILMDDGTITGFVGRMVFTRLGCLPDFLRRIKVFCEDGTVRSIRGYSDKRLQRPYSALLLLNGFYSGKPVLSEPESTYSIEELKSEVKSRLLETDSRLHRAELEFHLSLTQTLDDLLEIVMG